MNSSALFVSHGKINTIQIDKKDDGTVKIIYSCYGGAHSSIIASAIHMGYLPTDRIPSVEEILSTPITTNLQVSLGVNLFIWAQMKNREKYMHLEWATVLNIQK